MPVSRPIMNRLMIAALALAAAFTTYHIVRSVRAFVFWRQHADEPIQPWMTIGFVAHSYHVPPPALHEALGLPPRPVHQSLARIASEKGVPYPALRAQLYRVIAAHRQPPPPASPTASGTPR